VRAHVSFYTIRVDQHQVERGGTEERSGVDRLGSLWGGGKKKKTKIEVATKENASVRCTRCAYFSSEEETRRRGRTFTIITSGVGSVHKREGGGEEKGRETGFLLTRGGREKGEATVPLVGSLGRVLTFMKERKELASCEICF